jgi:TrmH family RNA methyltransferase
MWATQIRKIARFASFGLFWKNRPTMAGDFPKLTKDRLTLLDNIRVVLVNPKFPGNLGMVARSMKNTCVHDLRIVDPRAEINKEAYKLSVCASEILDDAIVHDDIKDAVGDCGIVIGTSKRRGVMRRNVLSVEEAAKMVSSAVMVNKVAVVFGSEDYGLGNEDLAHCQWIIGMHTGSDYESFNLSHSVAIVMYLINRAIIGHKPPVRKLANAFDLEEMYKDISKYLLETGFLHESDPKRMLLTIRRALSRAGLDPREVKILRGVIRQSRWRIKNPEADLIPRDTHQSIKREIFKKLKEKNNKSD